MRIILPLDRAYISISLTNNIHEFHSVKEKPFYISTPSKIKFRESKDVKCVRNSVQTASGRLRFKPWINNESCACLIICQRRVRCQAWQSEAVASRFCDTGIHLETQPPKWRDHFGLSLLRIVYRFVCTLHLATSTEENHENQIRNTVPWSRLSDLLN
jgi:hypothetical protein